MTESTTEPATESPVDPLAQFVSTTNPEASLEALKLAFVYGWIDGAHHKDWVIDQMCRVITGENYEAFVAHAKNGEEGPETYEWDEGIAP
jgi:hypothetical protein